MSVIKPLTHSSTPLLCACIFAVLVLPTSAFATAQIPDYLIYDGEEHPIHTNPLEPYFETHPRPSTNISCSALWRGYVATFEVKDDELFVVKLVLDGCAEDPDSYPLEKVFNGQKGPVRASWFSGVIVMPMGDMVQYVHMGYESVYEQELHLTFEKGKLVGKELIDNRPKDEKTKGGEK